MRTEQGKALIMALERPSWVTRAQIFEFFGTEKAFRQQVAEFRPELLLALAPKCTSGGIHVRTDSELLAIRGARAICITREAPKAAAVLKFIDHCKLSDEERRSHEVQSSFYTSISAAGRTAKLTGNTFKELMLREVAR